MHPPRLAERRHRLGSLHVIAFAYRVYYSQKTRSCQAQNAAEAAHLSASLLQKRGWGAYSVGLRIYGLDRHLNAVDRLTGHDRNRALDGCLMFRVHAAGAMRHGIEQMQTELTVVIVVFDILRTVRLTIDRADNLHTLGRGEQHRAALIADRVRRGDAVDLAQRRRIRSGQRLHVDVVAGGLDMDIERLVRRQVGQLCRLVARNADRRERAVRLVGEPAQVVAMVRTVFATPCAST